jgi:hypothetical protein
VKLIPCWSCDAVGPCTEGCLCAKCIDPEGYARWRSENPEEYRGWLNSQRDDGGAPDYEDDENYDGGV